MIGVILAAGRGGRLRGAAGDGPKCLMRIGGRTLLERQIHTLRDCGMTDVAVVAGFGAPAVMRASGARATIVRNDFYDTTNSLYSFWLARDLLDDGCVVLNGDVLFHRQLLVDLLTARYEDALVVGAHEPDAYSDEEMKVRVRCGRVVDIAKTLNASEADGENVGLAKFGPSGVEVLLEEVTQLATNGGRMAWLPHAFAAFCRRRPLYAVESRGFPWIEIDFPEDYERACRDVLPAIEKDFSTCMNASITCASVRSR